MQKLKARIDEWVKIGETLQRIITTDFDSLTIEEQEVLTQINRAVHHNGWFEKSQVVASFEEWIEALSRNSLEHWIGQYPAETFESPSPKRVGIVMAGNIPMVGLHDLLSVVLTGNIAVVKLSSDDDKLIPAILQFSPALMEQIIWAERLDSIDAVIATGSDNTARYFEHYFGKYPNVIRKNRKSAAVLLGDETDAELEELGKDVFQYYGMGCRSVSKLYIPQEFDVQRIFGAWMPYQDVVQNNKYGNNYDYHRAIMLLDRKPFLENGFVVLREHDALSSPVGTVHYERYDSLEKLHDQLREQRDSIQCLVSKEQWNDLPVVPLGNSQCPKLWDYADGVDTIAFLSSIH